MTFIVMLAILSVPFLAIWILALRGAARPGGKGDTLCMVPDARVIEPQYSGAEAEKAANYSACFTSVDRELYGVDCCAPDVGLSISDLSIGRMRVGDDPF